MSAPPTLEGRPGPRERTIYVGPGRGDVREVPAGWELLPPGDAGLTRRVKALGPTWTVKEKKGRRMFSRGVWAAAGQIAEARAAVEAQRADPAHQRKLEASRRRRDQKQAEYVVDFTRHVRRFLAFHPDHRALERQLASAIATHATPVGSGTVARTQRIPVERRAEAAVIAWMRHQTTAYDHMHIPRVKGKRREVRRMLAERSRKLLARYRRGEAPAEDCPLRAALTEQPPAPVVEKGPRGRAPIVPTTDHEAEQRARYEAVRARLKARRRK